MLPLLQRRRGGQLRLGAVEPSGTGLPLQMAYRMDGTIEIPESCLVGVSRYRGSTPVRVSNDVGTQLQLDSYGELLDCSDLCEVSGDDVMRTE